MVVHLYLCHTITVTVAPKKELLHEYWVHVNAWRLRFYCCFRVISLFSAKHQTLSDASVHVHTGIWMVYGMYHMVYTSWYMDHITCGHNSALSELATHTHSHTHTYVQIHGWKTFAIYSKKFCMSSHLRRLIFSNLTSVSLQGQIGEILQ